MGAPPNSFQFLTFNICAMSGHVKRSKFKGFNFQHPDLLFFALIIVVVSDFTFLCFFSSFVVGVNRISRVRLLIEVKRKVRSEVRTFKRFPLQNPITKTLNWTRYPSYNFSWRWCCCYQVNRVQNPKSFSLKAKKLEKTF